MTTIQAPIAHKADKADEAGRREDSGARATLAWGRLVVAWLVILIVGAVLVVGVLLPRLGGATPYTILTGSMQPNYPPGTLVVDKPVDPSEVQVGDVVTYQLRSGEATVVTHRVIGIGTGVDGKPTFLFQGDANTVPDADAVKSEQLRGRLWYAVPYLGRVNSIISGDQRQLAVYGVVGALGLYAASMFVGAARDRRRPAPEVGRHRI